jgi:hypothetical protein
MNFRPEFSPRALHNESTSEERSPSISNVQDTQGKSNGLIKAFFRGEVLNEKRIWLNFKASLFSQLIPCRSTDYLLFNSVLFNSEVPIWWLKARASLFFPLLRSYALWFAVRMHNQRLTSVIQFKQVETATFRLFELITAHSVYACSLRSNTFTYTKSATNIASPFFLLGRCLIGFLFA